MYIMTVLDDKEAKELQEAIDLWLDYAEDYGEGYDVRRVKNMMRKLGLKVPD